MNDPRYDLLASNLLTYSVQIQPGERIMIEADGLEIPLAKALIKQAYQRGANPFIMVHNHELTRELIKGCSKEQLQSMASYDLARVKDMDAYILIRAGENASQLHGLDQEKMKLYQKYYSGVINAERYDKTKWCILRYPTHALAQQAGMSTEDFEDFFFQVCNLDYSKLDRAMNPLVDWMKRTDKVRIIGPGTELEFSIKGMPVHKDAGTMNLPDGEVYTMPVKHSVNGTICYNTSSMKGGVRFDQIRLELRDGKIIDASANDTSKLNVLLNLDEGARYIGEFGIGLNPYIEKPMQDTLFDEKIWGSFHFTPGCVPHVSAGNKNMSQLHWDLVLIQRPEYGGGEMWFDDTLVRKDGYFVPDQLHCLNPDYLK